MADSVENPQATARGERTRVMSAPHRAKEIYQELRTALPPLLPGYLATQRWFGGKARQIRSVEITDIVPWTKTRCEAFVLLVRLEYTSGPGEMYVLPLIWSEEPMAESAATGLKEMDRLSLARKQMELRFRDRRSNSSLPQLADFVLSRPMVSSSMVAKQLRVTSRGALNLLNEIGIREITGRGRYRAWGII